MNKSLFQIIILFFCSTFSTAQDSSYRITKSQLLKYRQGYLVDTEGDTLRGLIYIDSDTSLFFIDAGKKLIVSTFAKSSTIPCIPAEYNIVKSFFRNGIFYENRFIPPDHKAVYLSILEKGVINLYALLSDYSDKIFTDNSVHGLLQGATGSMAGSNAKPIEEYYGIKDLYIQKIPDPEIVRVPKGEKRFRDVFIPLIRDNQTLIQELVGQSVDYNNVHSFVRRYNEIMRTRELSK